MDFDETQVGQRRSIDDGNFSCMSKDSRLSIIAVEAVVTFAVVGLVLVVVVLSDEVDVVFAVVKIWLVGVLEVVVVFLVVVVVLVVLVVVLDVVVVVKVVVFKNFDSSSVEAKVALVTNFSSVVDEDVAVVVFRSEVVVVCTDVGISVVNEANVSSGSSGTCSRAMSRTSLTICPTSSVFSSC